jgi:hypothetical protein
MEWARTQNDIDEITPAAVHPFREADAALKARGSNGCLCGVIE